MPQVSIPLAELVALGAEQAASSVSRGLSLKIDQGVASDSAVLSAGPAISTEPVLTLLGGESASFASARLLLELEPSR